MKGEREGSDKKWVVGVGGGGEERKTGRGRNRDRQRVGESKQERYIYRQAERVLYCINRFYIALFSALEQTHCARM